MSKARRIIGIDCGTAIVGWSITEKLGVKIKQIDQGAVTTHKSLDMAVRLEQIYKKLETIINEYGPTQMAIEDLFYFKNQKTVISVAQARGVIMLVGRMKGLETFGYTPLQIKSAVTGYGKADKKQVQFMVQKILGLKEVPKLDDITDAMAAAICHLNSTI